MLLKWAWVLHGLQVSLPMAPKLAVLSQLGSVQESGGRWRAQAKINGATAFGPQRTTKVLADADLAWARAASDREFMADRLQYLRREAMRVALGETAAPHAGSNEAAPVAGHAAATPKAESRSAAATGLGHATAASAPVAGVESGEPPKKRLRSKVADSASSGANPNSRLYAAAYRERRERREEAAAERRIASRGQGVDDGGLGDGDGGVLGDGGGGGGGDTDGDTASSAEPEPLAAPLQLVISQIALGIQQMPNNRIWVSLQTVDSHIDIVIEENRILAGPVFSDGLPDDLGMEE